MAETVRIYRRLLSTGNFNQLTGRYDQWLRPAELTGGGLREMRKFILSRCLRYRMDHRWMVVWMPAIISPKIGLTG